MTKPAFFLAAALCLIASAAAAVDENACHGPNSEDAIAACTAILNRDSRNVNAILNRASSYILVRGEYDRAISEIERALREPLSDYGRFKAHQELGLAYVGTGQFQLAAAEFDQSIQIRQSHHSLFGRGLAKFKVGNVSDGRADMNAALAAKPDVAKEWQDDWSGIQNTFAKIPE